jgi:hypothetical protein
MAGSAYELKIYRYIGKGIATCQRNTCSTGKCVHTHTHITHTLRANPVHGGKCKNSNTPMTSQSRNHGEPLPKSHFVSSTWSLPLLLSELMCKCSPSPLWKCGVSFCACGCKRVNDPRLTTWGRISTPGTYLKPRCQDFQILKLISNPSFNIFCHPNAYVEPRFQDCKILHLCQTKSSCMNWKS